MRRPNAPPIALLAITIGLMVALLAGTAPHDNAYAQDDQHTAVDQEVTPPAGELATTPATDAIAPAPVLTLVPMPAAAGDADPVGDPERKELDTAGDPGSGDAELGKKLDDVAKRIDDVQAGAGSKYTAWAALLLAVIAAGLAIVKRARGGGG